MRYLLFICSFIFLLINCGSAQQPFYDVAIGQGNGIRFWQNDYYKIHMGTGGEYQYGPVTDYSIKMNMSDQPSRGWTWGRQGQVPIAALNTLGEMQIAGKFTALGGGYFANNVGIGTSTPESTSRLHLFHASASTWLNIDKPNSTTEGGLKFSNNGAVMFYVWSDNSDNDALKIETTGLPGEDDATPRMEFPKINKDIYMVESGGSLGIGTTSPTHGRLQINQISDASDRGIAVLNSTGARAMRLWADTQNSYVYSGVTGQGNLILNGTGNVGVGTTNPVLGKFQVTQAIDNSDNGIAVLNSTGVRAMRLWSDPNNSYIYSGVTGHENLILNGTGNVGIGTTSPNQKLTVNGTIYGKQVKVDLSVPGPDYVFEKDYDLPSLEEVKDYIEKNKHLPEVPSAKEMEENGLNVGEMNMILLKKIEELTLYLIEKEKQIQKLENEFQQLRK